MDSKIITVDEQKTDFLTSTVFKMFRSIIGNSVWLRVGRSGDRIPVEARFCAVVQTGIGAYQTTSCKMGTWSLLGVKRPDRVVNHPPLSERRG